MTDLVVKLTEWFDHLDFDRENEATRRAEYSEMLEILAFNPKFTESGEALVFQLEAVIDRLDGQAYSSTLSALNQFKADLARPGPAATPPYINPVDTHDWEKQIGPDGKWNLNSVCRRCKCELMPAFRGISEAGTSPCPVPRPDRAPQGETK